MTDESTKKAPKLHRVILSTLAAAFGVQSPRAHEEDLTSTSVWPYVLSGVVFTALFVVGLLGLVRAITA